MLNRTTEVNRKRWTKARVGAQLTRNSDGSLRDKPELWMPTKRPLFIPPDGQDHARPLVVLEADDPDDLFVLMLNRTSVDGWFRGMTKRLVEL